MCFVFKLFSSSNNFYKNCVTHLYNTLLNMEKMDNMDMAIMIVLLK